jgi:hypothetical protein
MLRSSNVLLASAAALVLATGAVVVAQAADTTPAAAPGISCTGAAPAADGSFDLHCTVPQPGPSPTPTPTVEPTTVPPTTAPPTTTPPATVPPTTKPPTRTSNCLPAPSACGLPDGSNTGFPTGTALKVVNGNVSVSTAGTVIDGQDIKGCLSVSAANVVVRNSRITCQGAWVITARGANLLIQDTEVSCGKTQGKAIVGSGYTALRVNLHDCEDGAWFDPAGGTIKASYVHGMFHGTDGHTDSVQLAAGAHDVNVLGNTLVNEDPQGSSVISIDTTGSTRITIAGNLLAGGGYSLRCPAGTSAGFIITGNRFNTTYVQYAAWNDCAGEAGSGNVDDVTGKTLTP